MAGKDLPKKEGTLFKNILKMYEYKQYKKGLKSSDTILKKFPDHGETLTLKGLFLNHLNRKEEGYELARKGLKLSLTSSASWHIFGIMNRNDKNYEEALKAFLNALKYDKDNFQIIRDVCALQIHLRNYSNFNEISQQILELRPGNRPLWAGLATSYHLVGKLELAIRVLEVYEHTFKESRNPIDYEHSEILLYRNTIIQQLGDMDKALVDLENIESSVFDKMAWLGYKASVLKSLDRRIEASLIYRQLIKLNPDNKEYIHGLLDCDGLKKDSLSEEDILRVITIFDELRRDNPRSNLLKFLPLEYLSGESFQKSSASYIKSQLVKGVPSLFANLKVLYKDESKKTIIFQTVESFYESLVKNGTFCEGEAALEPPTAQLWALYYLAQHHDKTGNFVKALDLIDQAINHTPTLVEFHMSKARIYKHLGSLDKATNAMNDARELDLQDRYVNTKCTKYMLRNDHIEEAEKTIIMFIRPDCTDKLNELFENQCLWFGLESARSYYRTGNLSMALKRAHQIAKNFADFEDDQFDFHNYCLRKSTLRPYIDTLTFENNLYVDESYIGAVEVAVNCYLRLHNDPDEAKYAHDPSYAKLSPEEKKKYKQKIKKAATKNRQLEADAAAKKVAGTEKKKDDDPKGELLMTTSDPLGEAYKLLRPLLAISRTPLSIYHTAFKVLLAQRKLVFAFKALYMAIQKDAEHAENCNMLKKFIETYKTLLSKNLVHASLKDTLDSCLCNIAREHPAFSLTNALSELSIKI